MTNLVYINNGKVVTDSITVSVVFEKSHDHVMRDIRQQIEKLNEAGMAAWGVANFGETQYKHPQNKQMYPKFDLTEDAFALIAMSYITPKAMEMKVRFLQEFKRMKMQLEQPALPKDFGEALRMLASQWEETERIQAEKKKLQERIELDRPKVLFAEALEISKTSILVADMARMLKQNGINIGELRLYQYLRENGYLIKGGDDRNMPTQRSMELGLFEVKRGTRNGSDGSIKPTRTVKVTGKGQQYFINHFKKRGETA